MKVTYGLRKSNGFTLIELLIVIAIIGILAAIAIPNLLNALQRGKQKRTMADMRNVAIAIESYNIDNSRYPAAGCPSFPTANQALSSASFTLLKPTYIAAPPFLDGWSKPYHYGRDAAAQSYTIESFGRNGNSEAIACGTTTNFNADIVYSNGTFLQYPDGPQH